MALTTAQKLRIKAGMKLLTIHAPSSFTDALGSLPAGVQVSAKSKNYQQIHWFVQTKAEMEKELDRMLELLKEDVICWIYYPKGSSRIQTDLSRDKGWESLLKLGELQWLSLVSFDDTWSSFAMRLKNVADEKKEAQPKKRLIFDYADATAKTVRVPDDLAKAIAKNKKASLVFESLAYSHKREYVEWVITAKKEETRNSRINGTIEMLEKN